MRQETSSVSLHHSKPRSRRGFEGGYRVATFYGGITPYAAIQAQSFHTPGYSESDLIAGGFALGYNSRNANDTRSELGARFVVNGATPAKNSALTSADAELRLANGVALIGKFEGEFASHSSTYAGTGTVRYTW
jgi:uncharacterized protein with beta-barrel porin domain